jgi:fatty acid desaturase
MVTSHAAAPFNMIVGRWFLNAPLLAAFAPVRFNHLTHHKSLGEEHDYERILYDLSCGQRVNSRRVLLWLLKMSLGGAIIASLGRYVGLSQSPSQSVSGPKVERADLIAIAVAQAIIALLMWAATGLWWSYIVLWVVPGSTVLPGLLAFRGMVEHADPGIPPNYMLTFISNPIERFMVSPFNFNYHAEHHMFIAVSYDQLPQLRKFLLEKNAMTECVVLNSYFGRFLDVCRHLDAKERREIETLA